jgi:hypothetical protein
MLTPPRESTVILLPGDYQDRHDALVREVDDLELKARSDKRFKAKALKAAEAVDAFHEPANIPGVVVVTLREIPAPQVRRLQDSCPPRKGVPRDEVYGYNEDDFHKALIRACLVSPELTDEQFDEWAEVAPSRHWLKVRDAALRVVGDGEDIPKSSAVSVLLASRVEE